MLLELHVWGPAFSLASLDPECLASIALLSAVVPLSDWALIASSIPSQASPSACILLTVPTLEMER